MTDHTPDYRTVGEHFLDFTITSFNLAKSKYQQQNQIKANSVGFQALILLNQPGRSAPTMSELAARLEITKQQLTKLVNDLEEKDLVRREHDSRNRRQVYLYINPHRSRHCQPVKGSHAQLYRGRPVGFLRTGTEGTGQLPYEALRLTVQIQPGCPRSR